MNLLIASIPATNAETTTASHAGNAAASSTDFQIFGDTVATPDVIRVGSPAAMVDVRLDVTLDAAAATVVEVVFWKPDAGLSQPAAVMEAATRASAECLKPGVVSKPAAVLRLAVDARGDAIPVRDLAAASLPLTTETSDTINRSL